MATENSNLGFNGRIEHPDSNKRIVDRLSVYVYCDLTASSPIITSISPSSATNSGSQTFVIVGTGFSGTNVTLTKTGQSTITGVVTGTDSSILP